MIIKEKWNKTFPHRIDFKRYEERNKILFGNVHKNTPNEMTTDIESHKRVINQFIVTTRDDFLFKIIRRIYKKKIEGDISYFHL